MRLVPPLALLCFSSTLSAGVPPISQSWLLRIIPVEELTYHHVNELVPHPTFKVLIPGEQAAAAGGALVRRQRRLSPQQFGQVAPVSQPDERGRVAAEESRPGEAPASCRRMLKEDRDRAESSSLVQPVALGVQTGRAQREVGLEQGVHVPRRRLVGLRVCPPATGGGGGREELLNLTRQIALIGSYNTANSQHPRRHLG